MVTNNSCDYQPTQYNVQTGGTSGTLNNVAPSATSGVPVISQGASSQPVFGTAVVAGGGTGNTSATAYALLAGGTTTTGAHQSITNGAASSTVLIGNGTSSLPSFSATPQLTALGIGAAAGASGLTFDGTNLLGNYVDWTTWTPTLIGESTAGTTTYTTQTGYYTRIGNIAIVQFSISISAATGTGNVLIGGLPFTISGSSFSTGSISTGNVTFPSGKTCLMLNGNAGTSNFHILASGTAAGFGNVQMANAAQNFIGSAIYRI